MALGDLEFTGSQEEIRENGPPVKETLETVFAQNTSCHGLKNAATSRRKEVKIFWIVAVLLGFGLLLSQIILLFIQYVQFSAVTEFTVTNDNKIDFPSITICNYNRFKKSILQKQAQRYSIKYEDWQFYLTTTFGLSTWFYIYDRDGSGIEAIRRRLDIIETQLRKTLEARGENFNVTAFVIEASYELKDMIELHEPGLCFWAGQEYRFCLQSDFKPVLTTYGQCFTFHHVQTGAKLFQTEAGSSNALNMLVDIQQDEYSESLEYGFPQKGIKIMVHSPHVYPRMDSQGKAVSPGAQTLVGISGTTFQNAKDPWGTCVEKKLKYFVNYTIDGCEVECMSDFVISQCKCRPINLPGPSLDEVPVCSAVKMTGCVVEKLGLQYEKVTSSKLSEEYHNSVYSTAKDECGCKPACWYREYEVSISSAAIPNKNVAKDFLKFYNVTMDQITENYIFLDVYFASIGYEKIEQKEGMTFIKLISNIGGQMGLFIGASVITLFEFVEYFMMKIYVWWKERKIKKARKKGKPKEDTTDEEDDKQTTATDSELRNDGKKKKVPTATLR